MNITQTLKIPKPCKIDAPVYDHMPNGWYARNSVIVDDCVPTYCNSGGGVCDEYLTDLPTAIDQSIAHLNQSIATAEQLKAKLAELKVSLDG